MVTTGHFQGHFAHHGWNILKKNVKSPLGERKKKLTWLQQISGKDMEPYSLRNCSPLPQSVPAPSGLLGLLVLGVSNLGYTRKRYAWRR